VEYFRGEACTCFSIGLENSHCWFGSLMLLILLFISDALTHGRGVQRGAICIFWWGSVHHQAGADASATATVPGTAPRRSALAR
jgi:hypothetical protein